ncbi:hypothetical protein BFF78_07510 [Streptomyces fodineus]|uniref:Uncharacterized protein n=1 Tax=Streptomyces fodineus TaxID=1904616 RepID=A0A1D7Y5X6_9ACTN|nr:hypothetical protein [Streptomyces fodineus]AOR30916.1 hypothetical protein BFF78_07510 [Streptomyces fodineus]
MVSTPTGRNQLAGWLHRDRRHGVAPQVRGVAGRIIEANITMTDPATDTSRSSRLRLVTTFLDHKRCPARELAALPHQREETETAYNRYPHHNPVFPASALNRPWGTYNHRGQRRVDALRVAPDPVS